ncbi:hypothetical protein F5X71_29610 [Nocardia brasiliensis]|uniref:Uncharacterized protein n=1 Tax=Nocardia brasiliensis TaxID=37326 RepID=A0A6G9XYB5_NOCBR|nr:hypothetical protein [Nocardia brasiliensis]QIS05911.1 hypothetical protein F5X71_29610 [Nocardia brasiliensis]
MYTETGVNQKRARWADIGLEVYAQAVSAALDRFGRGTGQIDGRNTLSDADVFDEVASDFVGDLAHLARLRGRGIEGIILRGMGYFEAECANEIAEWGQS